MKNSTDETKNAARVGAIILAAGKSSRMGAFKPLLPFGATTVVEACIQHFRDAAVNTIAVVIGEGANAERLRNKLEDLNVIIAVNRDADSQMAASIALGAAALPASCEAVLINPVDHAAIPPIVISQLIEQWRQGAQMVKPTWMEKGGHPVLIDARFRHELLSLTAQGGLNGLMKDQSTAVFRLPVQSNLIARDMDTWDDYRSLHQEVFGVLPRQTVDSEQSTT